MILDLDWPEMRSKLLLILFFFSQTNFAQIIEAESRPYRYDIDRYDQVEGKSERYSFEIESIFGSIKNKIKKELDDWIQNHVSSDNTGSENIINAKYIEIRNNVVTEVGQSSFNSRTPNFLFHPEKLLFEIIINEFKPFFIEVASNEIEEFKVNFNKFQFSDQQFLYNDEKLLVLTRVTLQNPVTKKKYHYSDSNLNNYTWYPFNEE